ncbi:MAG: hypothetical protein HYR84_00200 [Planctomycetes bacterium]|nr:hypothetical protein [Planctomycetota bacterium]
MIQHLRWLTVSLLLGACPSWAAAEQVRYHFVPADACGKMAQVPAGPEGTLGELKRGLGARALPYPYGVRPNQMVTFRHPFSGRNVTVPIRMPDAVARMEHRADRIIYNFAEYTVEARFLPDGSVDIIYNSGFLRPLRFD